MPTADEVRNANPKHLTDSTFLVNLAVTFHVTSIPLAIFILIVTLIGCICFVAIVMLMVKSCLKRKFVTKRRKKPMKSMYLDEVVGALPGSEEASSGTLEYSLAYDIDRSQLTVGIIQASGLKSGTGSALLDPYVSLAVLKDANGTPELIDAPVRTPVIKQTTHPAWHRNFTFSVAENMLGNVKLKFDVFDFDSLAQDKPIGQLIVHLRDIDQAEYAGKIFEKFEYLQTGEDMVEGMGQVCVGLGFYPKFNRIEVTIYECKALDIDTQPDQRSSILISCELRRKKHTVTKSETKPKTELVNPYFNEKMIFPLKSEEVDDHWIKLRLREIRKMKTKKTLGTATIGFATLITTGLKHWESMAKEPGKVHVMWHPIVQEL